VHGQQNLAKEKGMTVFFFWEVFLLAAGTKILDTV
jgi:hypothetical protein